MRCANCKTDNPADGKFCVECGAALMQTCPRCGTPNSAAAKFCSECGERLLPADAAAGSPTITSAVGSQPDAVDGNRDGAALPDKHPPRFAAALSVFFFIETPTTEN